MFWILIFIFIVLLGLFLFEQKVKDEEFDKIPGPKGIFLFGNALDFLADSVHIIKHLTALNEKYKDFYKLKFGPFKAVILYKPEDIEILISGSQFNTKGYTYKFIEPWLKQGLILSTGEKWHQRRKILTPAFHFNILNHFNSIILDKCNDLVKKLECEVNNPKTDIYSYVSDLSLNAVCETAMGISLDKEAFDFSKRYKAAVHKLGTYLFYRSQKVWLYPNNIFNLSNVGRDQKYLLNLLSSFRDKVIAKRLESSGEGKICSNVTNDNAVDDIFVTKKRRMAMLDLLLEFEKEGKIDREGINEEVDSFMFAGYDTTATALQYILMLLANHKDAQDKILEESAQIVNSPDSKPTMNDLSQMKYLEACIKETLRIYPPVHFLNRQSDQPIQFTKYKCPPGTNYLIAVYELHRRSDQFEEPLEFRPERFLKPPTWHPFSYIPFSAGPRNCIGQKFAMMEMKLAVLAVLREYLLLPVTKPSDILVSMDVLLRSKEPIYVKIEKRNA